MHPGETVNRLLYYDGPLSDSNNVEQAALNAATIPVARTILSVVVDNDGQDVRPTGKCISAARLKCRVQVPVMPKRSDRTRDSYAAVPTTAWDMIRAARANSSEDGNEVLEELVTRYWKPIYAYFRSQGKSRHDAEELTQGFFCELVEGNKLRHVSEEKGRFRDWLLVCLRNYMYGQSRQARAAKRQPRGGILSLESLARTDGKAFEPAQHSDPVTAFDAAWRRDLLDRALKSVAADCQRESRELDFRLFLDYYCSDESKVTWQEVAARNGLKKWKDAARKADQVRAKLRRAIRGEVARYICSEDELDDELRLLIS